MIHSSKLPALRLVGFDQIANTLRIALAVSMAGDGVRAACRFNHDLRPENTCLDMNRSDLRDRNALLIAPEQAGLRADHTLRAHHEPGGKEEIALRPTRGCEGLGGRRIHCIES